MKPPEPRHPEARSRLRRVVVALDGSARSLRLIEAAKSLADGLGAPWEAVHIETPETSPSAMNSAAEMLGAAAQLGGAVASFPASDVANGLQSHLASVPADYLVIGASRRRMMRQTIVDRLTTRALTGLVIVVPGDLETNAVPAQPIAGLSLRRPPLRAFGFALLLVAATLVLAIGLQRVVGARVLDLLFLLPVMTVAARFGLMAAIATTAMSVAAYNFFLVPPLYTLGVKSPLSVIMTIVLLLIGGYTTFLTAKLSRRVALSDRSAQENASIAAFGQALANASDWETTAAIVCDEVAAMLKVRAAILREMDGNLVVVAAVPDAPVFGPVDHAALDWAWENGIATGSGTQLLTPADWQFQPLQTSLGRLAILAIARDTGRNPVRADQALLLATLLAQASLAHERLRLEDQIRANRVASEGQQRSQLGDRDI